MPDDLTMNPFQIALDALPDGHAPVPTANGAHVHAVGIGGPGAPSAWATLRQRRTAQMLMVTGWSCCSADEAELAGAVKAFARARGVPLIRATPDLPDAVTALGLEETGRGYAQRWLGDPIISPHHTGHYVQSTGFTCGPVSLAMAMGAVTRSTEIAIWREATTMIGLTGPGGCDPYGVALAAARRGFDLTLHFDATEAVLLDRANTEAKKDLMRFVQSEFRDEALAGLDVRPEPLSGDDLTRAVRAGGQVILLIDQCHTHDHHAPHWVLIHGERDGLFLVNDPWAEPDDGEGPADVDCIPVPLETLMRMGAYGDPAYHAAIVLRGRAA
ncbi:hypothetical protein LA6_003052 [Marinibacterium anthonyi]|nr:hypothetical protein LA6_003052 [Marinibacterium anthonyi]